ncbi:MAG: hypothetical protein WC787_04050 [Patescibacteria group bacterium]|jgi:hypothetical protein
MKKNVIRSVSGCRKHADGTWRQRYIVDLDSAPLDEKDDADRFLDSVRDQEFLAEAARDAEKAGAPLTAESVREYSVQRRAKADLLKAPTLADDVDEIRFVAKPLRDAIVDIVKDRGSLN